VTYFNPARGRGPVNDAAGPGRLACYPDVRDLERESWCPRGQVADIEGECP